MTKPATIPHRGMLADNVLKMRGRNPMNMVANPSFLGKGKYGTLVFCWHYPDCDIVLAYWESGYRVSEIVMVKEV